MPELQLFPYYPDQLISYELNIKGQERERKKKKDKNEDRRWAGGIVGYFNTG